MVEDVSQEPPWRASSTVDHGGAVETLLDLKAMRYLGPFLRGTRTLSEAAAEMGRATSTVAYWIAKLERAGLVERLDPVRRNGMAMPRYRAVAQELFVPFRAIPAGFTDVMDGGRQRILERFLDGLDEVFTADRYSGLRVRASGAHGVEIDIREPDPGPQGTPWVDFWGELRLDREQARRLASELRELVERYRDQETGTTEYLVHVGAAPRPRHKRRSAAHT